MEKLKKENRKGIILTVNCTKFQINARKETQDVFMFVHFYACDVILSQIIN